MKLYPLPFRMSLLRSVQSVRSAGSAWKPLLSSVLPWRPSCSYHVLSRLQPHGLSAEETHRVLSAAMVHKALAVDTVHGLVAADQIPFLTFQDLEGMPLFFMEWNRFSPLRRFHMVRSVVTSANADAAAELFLLRDPLIRLIIRVRQRQERQRAENDGNDNNWSA